MEKSALSAGIHLLRTEDVPLHGKFVLWDDDDIVITSLNWASASGSDEIPAGEIGVHVRCLGVAARVMEQLRNVFPELATLV